MSRRFGPWLTCCAVAGAVASSCGPGLETMHESNVRFEHCYRLDIDPKIAPSHREYCWRDWSRMYAYGQSRDRVEYARRRITALESGQQSHVAIHAKRARRARVFSEVGPTSPAEESAAPVTAPAPTSAHAPPPSTAPEPLARDDEAEAPAPVRDGGAYVPGSACADGCRGAWTTCQSACKDDEKRCDACREDYRGCMRRCFE